MSNQPGRGGCGRFKPELDATNSAEETPDTQTITPLELLFSWCEDEAARDASINIHGMFRNSGKKSGLREAAYLPGK
jgi:hypothetical protein